MKPALVTAAIAFVACIIYGYLKNGSPTTAQNSATPQGTLGSTLP